MLLSNLKLFIRRQKYWTRDAAIVLKTCNVAVEVLGDLGWEIFSVTFDLDPALGDIRVTQDIVKKAHYTE